MLRGSSRHDGIPLKQSAKDRDRDRQREQQRKERAQMLPDDKEIHPSAQDLFQPPCKVQQPFEDTTAVQIQNTLGSFDSVRHLILDPSSRRLANLVGVDQGSPVVVRVNPADPHRPAISASTGLVNNSSSLSSSSVPLVNAESSKSHHTRSLFPVNHLSSGSTSSNNNTSGQSSTSNLGSSLATNSFRTSSSNPPSTVQKVPHSQNSQHNTNNYTSTNNLNPSTSAAAAPNFTGPILSTKSPNLSNSNSSGTTSSNQGRPKANVTHGQSSSNSSATLLDVNVVDGISGSSNVDKNNSVFDNVPISNHTSSAPLDKSAKNSSTNKKSTFERADSQLELETILKEMTDVTPPITAIQTPIKENSTARKQPQRRSSKSEEKIVQSIINSGMANVPSPVSPVPVPKMDSSSDGSSSSLTDSDSESEDSSSGSHSGSENKDKAISQPPSTSSPTQRSWSLHSFIKKPGLETSSKDDKSNSFSSVDSEQSSEDLIPNPDIAIPSTSTFNPPQSASPIETPAPVTTASTAANHATKPTGRTRSSAESRESNIPSRQAPSSIPTKGSSLSNKISSLTASSSDEEEDNKPVKKAALPKSSVAVGDENKVTTPTSGGTRKRPRGLSMNANRHNRTKGAGDSSPETATNKKKGVQDRNKSDTIRKLFRPVTKAKQDSPNVSEVEAGKSNNGSTAAATTDTKTTSASASGTKQSASNRVSGKDSGRKKQSAVHNGELDSAVALSGASEPAAPAAGSKSKKDASKDKDAGHNKKHAKQTTTTATSHGKSPATALSSVLLPPPPVPSRVKEDTSTKSNISHSSLIVRIPLDKIVRKPKTAGNSAAVLGTSLISPALNKKDKDGDKGRATGGTNSNSTAAATSASVNVGVGESSNVPGGSNAAPQDPLRLKVQNNSSRVGSSSDTSNQPFAPVDPSIPRDRDDSLCSDSERLKNHSSKKRPRKKSRSSPRKLSKVKRDTETYHPTKTKLKVAEEEISSNVLGYNNCDSLSVTTTRTPPIESDIIQAPDSSLNPPHLPSPVIPQQLQYFSLFEKSEHKDDLFTRDQDSYLEEAKKLKHKADGERSSAAQASMYLEAGLYFILTGILMEREINAISSVYTMFKDTLSLITFIGNRWRARPDIQSILEAKIIILSMRCQALLSMKLFKLKMRETKEMVSFMQTFFNAPQRDAAITSSPILSTPSPHSPTSSPAGSSSSSGIFQHTPSPHHPHQNHHPVTAIPRTLYAQMQKQCSNALNVILAHDTWEQADALVAKHRVEEFFIGIDRQNGPLTLHSSLVDLVRYVRQGLQVLSGGS